MFAAILALVAVFLVSLLGCLDAKSIAKGGGINVGTGEVFQCTDDATSLELCWNIGEASLVDELAAMGGTWACVPTARHAGPCIYQCPPPPSGCNAENGCFCP